MRYVFREQGFEQGFASVAGRSESPSPAPASICGPPAGLASSTQVPLLTLYEVVSRCHLVSCSLRLGVS